MTTKIIVDKRNFNPRTRVECDVGIILIVADRKNFNPRTRVECDLSLIGLLVP